LAAGSPLSVCPEQRPFADVPAAIVEQLFLDGNFIPQLQDLLFLHLLPGAFSTAALMLARFSSVLMERLLIDFSLLNLNNVVDGDTVSNGVVHVIDGVLVPSWVFNSLTDRVFANDDLSTIQSPLRWRNRFLDLPHLRSRLTNDAFALLDTATIDFLTSTDRGSPI
jgi:hypothetical protein